MKHTAFFDLHTSLGAKMVDFAGYSMPIQYTSMIDEHRFTRTHCGLFDVSHMGAFDIFGENVGLELEKYLPSTLASLGDGRAKYTIISNENFTIVDDCIITKINANHFLVVLNASRKDEDIRFLTSRLPALEFRALESYSMLAVQGPLAEDILASILPEVREMKFSDYRKNGDIIIHRTGYTGEDGFELMIPDAQAIAFAESLLSKGARFVGLGARDSLRLEAGLCLYGNDIDETTTPLEAGLGWLIRKDLLESPFIPKDAYQKSLVPTRKLTKFLIDSKMVARHNAIIKSANGAEIGVITSGAFSPTLSQPIAMGYIAVDSKPDDAFVDIRGSLVKAEIVSKFIDNKYKK